MRLIEESDGQKPNSAKKYLDRVKKDIKRDLKKHQIKPTKNGIN